MSGPCGSSRTSGTSSATDAHRIALRSQQEVECSQLWSFNKKKCLKKSFCRGSFLNMKSRRPFYPTKKRFQLEKDVILSRCVVWFHPKSRSSNHSIGKWYHPQSYNPGHMQLCNNSGGERSDLYLMSISSPSTFNSASLFWNLLQGGKSHHLPHRDAVFLKQKFKQWHVPCLSKTQRQNRPKQITVGQKVILFNFCLYPLKIGFQPRRKQSSSNRAPGTPQTAPRSWRRGHEAVVSCDQPTNRSSTKSYARWD